MAKHKHRKSASSGKTSEKVALPKPAKSAPSFIGRFAENPIAAADKVADQVFPRRLNVRKQFSVDA